LGKLVKRFAHSPKSSDISIPMDLPVKLISYLTHRIFSLSCRKSDGFILDFKHNVLYNNSIFPEFQLIEQYRADLLLDKTVIETIPYGAGTRSGQHNRTIGHIARVASVPANYGRLLFRLVRHFQPDQIIEMGTALGISTMYLAMGNPAAKVITVEGNPLLVKIASERFSVYGLDNITLINSTFDDAIPRLIRDIRSNTLIYIDGNHTLEATLRYYQLFSEASGYSNIMVLDDINWSYPMTKAWKIITGTDCKGVIIDLFRLGIIFQGQNYKQQKIRLRY
jgi:predicted O-methyltransferase YrrM